MPGYVIADVTVTDPETYAGYRKLTPGTIEAFGGRFLVRGGAHEAIAGDWQPGRLVLLAFDSPARAAAWYDSPAYVEARAIRQRASTGSVVLLEGDGSAEGAEGAYLIVRHGAEGAGLAGAARDDGRILVSARTPQVREGTWAGERVTVLAFADREAAQARSASLTERQAAGDAVLVEGV